MTRLLVLVEGQTEERFVNQILRPHLLNSGVFVADAKLIGSRREKRRRGGICSWPSAKKDIVRCLKEDRQIAITTMVDFYAMPAGGQHGWPGRSAASGTGFKKAEFVESAVFAEVDRVFKNQLSPQRFLPFVMMHEFESLLFSDTDKIVEWMDCQDAADALTKIRFDFPNPEEINDSKLTAPSKRIQNVIPEYEKVVHGNDIVEWIGLSHIRQTCSHFDRWLSMLEQMGTSSSK